ncbi:MAG: hypothetical protein K2W80_10320 [Burkholderiales bacterium]|nr:hypothetical protein [Burkholderiales bacterium]
MSIPARQHQVFCAVCQRQVDHYQMMAARDVMGYLVGAKCHGKTETADFQWEVPATVVMFEKEAAELKAQRERDTAAPADYFVCLSMLVTGRHKHPNLMLGKVDMIARDIALEGNL